MTELLLRKERRLRLGFGVEAMKKLKVCPACGMVSSSNQTKCRSCGALLPKETLYALYRSRHKLCSHCHEVVSNDASFCPSCGRKLQK